MLLSIPLAQNEHIKWWGKCFSVPSKVPKKGTLKLVNSNYQEGCP
jgi:hypothetical protein